MNVVPLGMLIVAVLGVIGAALKLLWDAAQFFKGMRDDLHNMATDIGEHIRQDEKKFEVINDEVSVLKLNVARVQTHLGMEAP